MKWWPAECKPGDMIRIKLGSIYHYGIFVSENEIIQFGPPPVQLNKIADKNITVISTDIQTFSSGSIIEVARFDRKEKKQARSPEKIVEYAKANIGMGGYNLLHNNCEHFANLCVFGIKRSEQEEQARKKWADRPILDVYISKVPENVKLTPLFPPERQNELDKVTNTSVKNEKYWAWKTLEYALLRTFGFTMEAAAPVLEKTGKWTSKRCYFSFSHSNSLVAVAVSNNIVGIDIEDTENFNERILRNNETTDAFLSKIFSDKELKALTGSVNISQTDFCVKAWTQKEAAFKYQNKNNVFLPKKITLNSENLITKLDKYEDTEYCLSVCCKNKENLRYYTFTPDKL